MKYRITTETGSLYELDSEKMTWERLTEGVNSIDNTVRQPHGDLKVFPKMIVGESLVLLGTPLQEGFTHRLITTSPVKIVLAIE